MPVSLQAKVAVITGGGSGIGRAAALAFAQAGAFTVVADIAPVGGEETAHLIEHAGGKAVFVRTDVTSAEDVDAMVAAAVREFGRLDCAFNNAGVVNQDNAPIAETTEAEWDRIVDVDLKGVWRCMRSECRQMVQQKSGAIVNTSSIMGKVGGPGIAAYCAAKAGVIGLTKSAALDYAGLGIRINAVCPGGVNTPMTVDASPVITEKMGLLVSATPLGRMADVREIADAVIWLCSEHASFVTGQAIAIDGGYGVC